jgi:hypothetical protein
MSTVVYVPYAACTIGGNFVQCSGGRVESSFSDPVSKGYAKFYTDPGGWSQGDTVVIALGAGANNVECFGGIIMEGDWLNSGPNFELVCRGPLIAAQKFRNNRPKGRTLWDLTGGPATDEAIAQAVLDIAGVTNIGSIGGTGIIRGATAPDGYTWRQGESALEYQSRLSKSSTGYKLAESTDGQVYRAQVLTGGQGAPDITLTEGVDIFDGGHTQIETFDTFDAWEVTGFDYGDGLGPLVFRQPDPIPDGSTPYAHTSEQIERDSESDPRSGISCEAVLNYLRGESSDPIKKISGLQTPRDDLLGPGSVVEVNSDMLGVHGSFWVVSVTREVTPDWFIQTLELVG